MTPLILMCSLIASLSLNSLRAGTTLDDIEIRTLHNLNLEDLRRSLETKSAEYKKNASTKLLEIYGAGNFDYVSYLLELGADPNAPDEGCNVLALLAREPDIYDFFKTMELLLQHKANPDKCHALEYLFRFEYSKRKAELLLQFKANPLLKNKEGKTALDLAQELYARRPELEGLQQVIEKMKKIKNNPLKDNTTERNDTKKTDVLKIKKSINQKPQIDIERQILDEPKSSKTLKHISIGSILLATALAGIYKAYKYFQTEPQK